MIVRLGRDSQLVCRWQQDVLTRTVQAEEMDICRQDVPPPGFDH